MSVIAQFKDTCVFPTTAFVFESYLKGDTLLILFKCYHQRPKKSELSGWQLSTHKNLLRKKRTLLQDGRLPKKACQQRGENQTLNIAKRYRIGRAGLGGWLFMCFCVFLEILWR